MAKIKKRIFSIISFLFIIGISATPCLAITLLTEKEALRRLFPSADEVVVEKKNISDAQLNTVKTRLEEKLVNYEKSRTAKQIIQQKEFDFYFAIENGKKSGVAIILEEPGKWGPIEFIVKLNLEGVIGEVIVMRYTETRGRPIARRSFLKQFAGKTAKDTFKLRKDIVAVSGATISSGAAAFTVKKAIVLYEELYLRNIQSSVK
ncbi:MAG: FMN-binding protein [Candidatus Omnitrophota bacterium]